MFVGIFEIGLICLIMYLYVPICDLGAQICGMQNGQMNASHEQINHTNSGQWEIDLIGMEMTSWPFQQLA